MGAYMANKKKRKRQREAAARKLKGQPAVTNDNCKPKTRWNAAKAVWEHSDGSCETLESALARELPEEREVLRDYHVAVRTTDNTPMHVGPYRAPNETALIKLICMNTGATKEGDLAYLEIHWHRPDGSAELIREGPAWPQGVEIIRHSSVVQQGRFGEARRVTAKATDTKIIVPEIKSSARPKDPPNTATITDTTEKVIEKKIPRVPYALIQAA